MAIYQLGDLIPRIDPTAFIFDSADLIGDVVVGAQASIWANVSIRGDNTCIDIGHHSNVQEGSVLHSDAGVPLTIAPHVTIGHQAMLHASKKHSPTSSSRSPCPINLHFKPTR